MYDAVLLDMDGVILRGQETPRARYERAVRQLLREQGVGNDPKLLEVLIDPDPDDLGSVRRTIAEHGLDPTETWQRRESLTSQLANRAIARGDRRFFDDIDVLNGLGLPLGLVSNNRHATVRFVAERSGLPFGVVRGRDPTFPGYARMKPDPYYLQDALEDLDAERPVYVGDRRTDLEAAAEAGVASVLLDRPGTEPASPRDVTPDATVDTFQALPDLLRSRD